ALRGRLWERLKAVALTDVAVLVRGLDRDALERVERVLVEADFGSAAFDLAEELEQKLRRGEIKHWDAARSFLAGRIAAQLRGANDPGTLTQSPSPPTIVLFLGVNGTGKTTQTAKLAYRLRQSGKTMVLA